MAPKPIYEERRLGLWYKPAGLMVEPDRFGHPHLQQVVAQHCGKPVWPIHRLDRPTSGLVLFAYQKSAVAPLMELFEHRRIQKEYVARLERPWTEGTVEWWDYGVKNPREFRMDVVPAEQPGAVRMGLKAAPTDREDEVRVTLMTGKYHQIRAQFGARNWPLRGDVLYGAQPWDRPNSIALHAARLSWLDPWTGIEHDWQVAAPWND